MAIQVTHATTAVGTEAGDGEIGKAEWNADHSLSMATDRILGRTTAGAGSPEELTAGSGLTLASGSLDVAGYKYLGRVTKGTGSIDCGGSTFVTWQQTYQRMKVVLTTSYGSAMYYRFYLQDGITPRNINVSYMAFGNTGSYPRTADYTNQASAISHWYTYHYFPTLTLDIFSADGTTIADTVASYPRLFGQSYGRGDLYPEQIYMGAYLASDITSSGFFITTNTSGAQTTLDAWGL